MNLFKIILNSKLGFSLAEMMVAVGLVGLISVGSMNLISDGYKAQTLSMVKVELEEIVAMSKVLLSNKAACSSSLVGADPSVNTPVTIVNALGANTFWAGQEFSNRRIQITSITVTNFREKTGELTNDAGDGVTNREGYVTIVFNFNVSAFGDVLNDKWNVREVEAYVRLATNADTIEACGASEDQAVISANREYCVKDIGDLGDSPINNTLDPDSGKCEVRTGLSLLSNSSAQKICSEIGGTWTADAVAGLVDGGDGFQYPNRGRCVLLEKNGSCPVGEKLLGFAANGSRVCGP